MKRFKNILVTGAAGFVGRHMMDAVLARGLKLVAMDNFSSSSKTAVRGYFKRAEWVEGDIRDPKAVRRAMRGIDAVYHFAAIRSVVRSVEDPVLSHEVNASGTLLLLEEAARVGVKHFLFTSTSAVYGAALARLQKEEGPFEPMSPYGMAKFLSEQYARYFYLNQALPTTSFRIFNVYGPRQNPESKYSLVVPGVMDKILKNQRPVIDGSGKQSRDFVYIGDVVDAFFKCLGDKRAYGRVYNLGAGKAYSINTLVGRLTQLSGSKLKPKHGPRRPGDPDRTCADVSRIKKEIGWKPHTGLEQGLGKTVSWYLGQK